MFLSQADGTICQEVDKKKEKEFYEKVQQIISGDKEIEEWVAKEDPSIRQLLEKIKDDLGGQEVVDHFIAENVEPRLSTVFIGNADTLSAQVILSRMVPSIKIPEVNFEDYAGEVRENPAIQKEIDEYQHEYAKNQRAFFVAHKEGFSTVYESLKQKMESSGRCTFNVGQGVESLTVQQDKVHVKTASGETKEFEKVLSCIDGLALKDIVEKSAGIQDSQEVLNTLNRCEYGDMASCNIVYDEEISKDIMEKMPEKYQHVLVVLDKS